MLIYGRSTEIRLLDRPGVHANVFWTRQALCDHKRCWHGFAALHDSAIGSTTRTNSEVRFLDRMRRVAFTAHDRNLAAGFRCALKPGPPHSESPARSAPVLPAAADP